MTLNLDTEWLAIDPRAWTPLQTEICMNVANAKLYGFAAEAERIAGLVRLGLLTRAVASDYLQTAAIYNQLAFEYGADRVQEIMSAAFEREAAA